MLFSLRLRRMCVIKYAYRSLAKVPSQSPFLHDSDQARARLVLQSSRAFPKACTRIRAGLVTHLHSPQDRSTSSVDRPGVPTVSINA